ncbi:MAG: S26 family signal peptidase [Actinobacteria bacterium]|nr:S26 family signal peptidase [Actinomycetota bacterium]
MSLGKALVRGLSMVPNLGYGDELLIRYGAKVSVGDVVVFRRAGQNDIKRVESISDEGVFVVGDNLMASLDSRAYGLIRHDQVLGKALFRIKPKFGRIGNNKVEADNL